MLLFVLFSFSFQFYQTVSGGAIKQKTNSKFTWISPTLLDVSFPSGWQDRIKLMTTSSIPGVYDPCLFTGKFMRETNASITVSGCHNDTNIEITIFSSHLQGHHIFRITDGEVVNLNENATQYTNDGVLVPGDEARFPSGYNNDGVDPEEKQNLRFRRQSFTVTNYVDDFAVPPPDNSPTLAGGGASTGGSRKIPSVVTINMKLGYEDSFLKKMGSRKAAEDYINKVVTHGKSYFLIPSLRTKIYLKFPESPVHYPGHAWQPDLHLHEARQYQKDASVPHTFFCHKEGTYFDGFAYVGGACRPDGAHYGVALEKWHHDLVYAGQTFAHETGHLFGMHHDFVKSGDNYANYPSQTDSHGNWCKNTGLMSYGDPLRVTKWSTCSLEYFTDWYNERGFACLKETTDEDENIASVSPILGCSCNGFIDKDDGGECLEEYGEFGYWCYVEDGSCSDAILWQDDLYYSYEACKKTTTAPSTTEKSAVLSCSCNGFLNDYGGECLEEYGNAYGYWCFVEDGSCSDATLWYDGLYFSYEACKKSTTAPATTGAVSSCSCNGIISDDGGECLKEYGENGYWCYVGGSCSDAILWYDGVYFSYEACKKTTTAIGNINSPSACSCNYGGECKSDWTWCYVDEGACSDNTEWLGKLISYEACKKTSSCSCNYGGECKADWTWCYVDKGACSDTTEWLGKYRSYQACNRGTPT